MTEPAKKSTRYTDSNDFIVNATKGKTLSNSDAMSIRVAIAKALEMNPADLARKISTAKNKGVMPYNFAYAFPVVVNFNSEKNRDEFRALIKETGKDTAKLEEDL